MSAAASLRCPQCAAHAPAGAQWCTLCYADLRPTPEVSAAAVTNAPATERVQEPTQVPVQPTAEAVAASPRGKHARRAAGAEGAGGDVDALAASMLAELAASTSSPVGRWSGLADSTGKKVALMLGGSTVLMLAFFVLMAVLGALL